MDHTETLVKACANKEFPHDRECLKTFMFDSCRSIEECKSLLSLYTGIINDDPRFRKEDLDIAVTQSRLVDYIIRMYRNRQSTPFDWFKLNIERWIFR